MRLVLSAWLARCGFACVGLLFATAGRAQYTDNYQTNIISGVISNWFGDYVVGGTYSADVLLMNNGGVLNDQTGILAI